MTLYKLWNDDILLLKEVEKYLRSKGENNLANDIALLKGRIKYLVEENVK